MNDASRLAIGQAQYSALLYPQGTFVDDVIVHRLGEDDYLLVINAGTREKDFNWVRDNTRQFDCKVEHLSDDFTQIAIQGPKGVDVLQKLTDADLSAVKFYWVTRGTVCGLKNILMGRTGYTAEDGFEIYIPADEATSARVWYEILEAGKEFGVSPAAWVRATRCAWKEICRSTATKSPTRSMCGKRDWIASARWRSRILSAAPPWKRRKPKA
jgi:aminomethyltransferase